MQLFVQSMYQTCWAGATCAGSKFVSKSQYYMCPVSTVCVHVHWADLQSEQERLQWMILKEHFWIAGENAGTVSVL